MFLKFTKAEATREGEIPLYPMKLEICTNSINLSHFQPQKHLQFYKKLKEKWKIFPCSGQVRSASLFVRSSRFSTGDIINLDVLCSLRIMFTKILLFWTLKNKVSQK